MLPFRLISEGQTLTLQLTGQITIEQARPLYEALCETLCAITVIRIDAAAATRIDVAALQVLLAATRSHPVEITTSSEIWSHALTRFGIPATAFTASPTA